MDKEQRLRKEREAMKEAEENNQAPRLLFLQLHAAKKEPNGRENALHLHIRKFWERKKFRFKKRRNK